MQAAFQKKTRLQKKNEPSVEAAPSSPVEEPEAPAPEPIAEAPTPEPQAEVAPEPSAPKPPLVEPTEEKPSKIYNAEERQALAEEMLPPDVLEYLKEEFRAQFSSVRKLTDRKVY